MKLILFLLLLSIICSGCGTVIVAGRPEAAPAARTKVAFASFEVETKSEGSSLLFITNGTPSVTPGAPGIISANRGIVLVLRGTNMNPLIVFTELYTGKMQTVGRYIHDRVSLGDSVAMIWGTDEAPHDRPSAHYMHSTTVTETNRYAIEHPKLQ